MRVIVRDVPPSEIQDLYWVRCALEGMAARLATPRLTEEQLCKMEELCAQYEAKMRECRDEEDFAALSQLGAQFHPVFIQACENYKLQEILADVKEYINRYRGMSITHPGRAVESLAERRAILEAFKVRDADAAEARVRAHVNSVARILFPELKR